MKVFKKALMLLLVVALLVNVAGCKSESETEGGTSATAEKNSDGSSDKSEGGTSEEAGKAKISMMTYDFEGSPLSGDHAEEVVAAMEEHTNTEVDFTFVPSDNYEDKLGLTMASPDDMPMIIAVGKLNAAITGAAEAGAFWDLKDYMFDAEKYPNLATANKNVLESLTVGGDIIGIYRARDIGRFGIGYRADWAEALGIEVPTTVEELYDMMYAFTYDDPDGNGEDDTYGLALCKYTGPLDIMQTFFGVGNGWVDQDGTLVPVHMTDEYQEALKWFKKMYDDGLVYEDWAVRDTATWADSVKNGECGMFIDVLDGSRRIWDYYVNNDIPAAPGSSSYETAAMNLIGTIDGKTMATAGYNGFFVITKAAETEEDLAACLNFLDKMCDDEMLILSSYGLEGPHWEIGDDGFVVDLDKEDPQASKAYAALNQTVAYIAGMESTLPLEKSDRKILEQKIKAENVEYAVFNPVPPFLINSETYSLSGAVLDQMVNDARTQYIVGEISLDELKEVWSVWEQQGGSSIIEEVNAQYQ